MNHKIEVNGSLFHTLQIMTASPALRSLCIKELNRRLFPNLRSV